MGELYKGRASSWIAYFWMNLLQRLRNQLTFHCYSLTMTLHFSIYAILNAHKWGTCIAWAWAVLSSSLWPSPPESHIFHSDFPSLSLLWEYKRSLKSGVLFQFPIQLHRKSWSKRVLCQAGELVQFPASSAAFSVSTYFDFMCTSSKDLLLLASWFKVCRRWGK